MSENVNRWNFASKTRRGDEDDRTMDEGSSDGVPSTKTGADDQLDFSGFYDLDGLSRGGRAFSLSDFASTGGESDAESECYEKASESSSTSTGIGNNRGSGSTSSGGSGKSRYKHVPHREKPVQVVARRNARERRRVQTVNSAFTRLRKHIPYENRHKRLSKVKTLRIAIDYIRQLQDMLGKHDSVLNGLLSNGQLSAEMLQEANQDCARDTSAALSRVQPIQNINNTPTAAAPNVDMASQLPVDTFSTGMFAEGGNFLDLMTSPNLPLPGTPMEGDWGSTGADMQELLQLPD